MRLTNRHASVAPVIEERPGRYLAYFENKFGEQLVFVHDDGESDATVLLGDVGWEPCRVSDAGGLADVGELILNDGERAFVNACWIATAWRCEDARPAARWHCRPTICRKHRPGAEALLRRGLGRWFSRRRGRRGPGRRR